MKILREQVVGYNQGIIKAAKTSKVEHLKAFLTEQLVEKTMLWVKAYHDDNLFMDAIINKIEFDSIKPDRPNKSAVVKTKEQWRYRYINIKDKKEVHPPTKIFYEVKYTFILIKNQWIIKDVTVLNEDQKIL